MNSVTVFAFKMFDIRAGEFVVSRYKAPGDWVKQKGGEIIPGTEEEVAPTSLNDDGLYDPAKVK